MSRADQYEPLPDDAATRWAKFGRSETVFYPMLLGLEVEETRIDYCRMRLAFKAELLQPGGLVHGGAIASLMDAVLVPAVGSVLGPKDRYSTVDLHVQYIGAVKDEDVVAGTEENRLTLVTADPPYRAVERLVVVARFDGDADGAPLRTVPAGLEPGPDELGLGRDANAVSSVMLFMLLGGLSVLGFVGVRRRWTTWALWAVFVPIWLAGGVMLFENMLRWFPATL